LTKTIPGVGLFVMDGKGGEELLGPNVGPTPRFLHRIDAMWGLIIVRGGGEQ
jgi:hypothetical protein